MLQFDTEKDDVLPFSFKAVVDVEMVEGLPRLVLNGFMVPVWALPAFVMVLLFYTLLVHKTSRTRTQ